MAEFDDIINDDVDDVLDTSDTPDTHDIQDVDIDKGMSEKSEDKKPDYMKYITGESEEDVNDKKLSREEEILTEYGLSKEELEEARKMGWKDKNGFEERNGKKFVGPKEFLDKAKNNANIYKERFEASQNKIKEQEALISDLSDKITKIVKKQYDNEIERLTSKNIDLENKIKEAKESFEYDKIEELSKEKLKNEMDKEDLLKQTQKEEEENKAREDSLKNKKDIFLKQNNLSEDNLSLWEKNTDNEMEATWQRESKVFAEIKDDPIKKMEFDKFILFLIRDYPNMSSADRLKTIERKFSEKTVNSMVDGGNSASSKPISKTGWDGLSKAEKEIAINVAKNFSWWKDKDTNPTSKQKWEQYKNYYDKKDEE